MASRSLAGGTAVGTRRVATPPPPRTAAQVSADAHAAHAALASIRAPNGVRPRCRLDHGSGAARRWCASAAALGPRPLLRALASPAASRGDEENGFHDGRLRSISGIPVQRLDKPSSLSRAPAPPPRTRAARPRPRASVAAPEGAFRQPSPPPVWAAAFTRSKMWSLAYYPESPTSLLGRSLWKAREH